MTKTKNKFLSKISFDAITNALSEILKRFPLPFSMAIVTYVFSNMILFDLSPLLGEVEAKIILTLVGSFFLLTSLSLYRESHGLSDNKFNIASVLAVAGLGAISFFAITSKEPYFLFVIGACFLCILAAPYLHKEKDTVSYWFYNQKTGLSIAMGFLVALIFFLGLAAALASLNYLFGVSFNDKGYSAIWLFSALLLGPFYTLAHLPDSFKTTVKEGKAHAPVTFIGNWILAPLVILYLVILYAYFVKIAVTMEIPKNELSSLIVGFGLVGIATYKIGWIYEAVGHAGGMIKFLQKYFFKLLIVPTLMLLYAIGVRINDYGVTEERYIVLAAALWFAFLIVGVLSQKLQLKHMTVSLILIAFFCAWGPWGMQTVSKFSQTQRLEALLVQYNILKDGNIVEAEKDSVPDSAVHNIQSIARYLSRSSVRGQKGESLYGHDNYREFMKAAGLRQNYNYSYDLRRKERNKKAGRFEFIVTTTEINPLVDVSSFDRYVPNFSSRKGSSIVFTDKVTKPYLSDVSEEGVIRFNFRDYGSVEIPMDDVIAGLLTENPDQNKVDEFYSVEGQNDKIFVRYDLQAIKGKLNKGEPVLEKVSGRLFVREK